MNQKYSIKKPVITGTLVVMTSFLMLFTGCENQAPLEPSSQAAANIGNAQTGFSGEEITWLAWNPALLSEIAHTDVAGSEMLERVGSDFELVDANQGGTVGGNDTHGNMVDIPGGALTTDTWIAVQVGCMQADQFYGGYDLSLLHELVADIEARVDYLGDNIDGSKKIMNKIESIQEGIFEFKIFIEVYSYLIENYSFNILRNDIIKDLEYLADEVADGDIDSSFLDDIELAAYEAASVARILAEATIEFALNSPEYDASDIDDALDYLADGDDELAENDLGALRDAVKEYRKSWNKAKDAVPGISEPSAEIDFLPDMVFNENVTITLSWADVVLPEEIEGEGGYGIFEVFFTQDGEDWFPVEEPEIDESAQTITFDINHFTRYAWGIRPTPVNDGDDGEGRE